MEAKAAASVAAAAKPAGSTPVRQPHLQPGETTTATANTDTNRSKYHGGQSRQCFYDAAIFAPTATAKTSTIEANASTAEAKAED